jgi:hypothetical protein
MSLFRLTGRLNPRAPTDPARTILRVYHQPPAHTVNNTKRTKQIL